MSIRSLVPLAMLVVAVAAIYVFPLVIFSQSIGNDWQGIMPEHIEDAQYYYSRIHEVAEGNIFFGNPAYLEHKNATAPSWGLAEIFSALPLILSGSWTFTVIFNILFWALFASICIYATLRLLGIPQWVSALGAFFVSLQLVLLTTRPVSMQVPYASLFLFVYVLVLWIQRGGYSRAIYLSVVSVIALMTYTFTGQIAACVLGIVAAWFIIAKKKERFFELVVAGLVASPLFIAYAWVLWATSQDPFYFETLIRFGLVETRFPMIEVYFYGRWLLLMVAAYILLILAQGSARTLGVRVGVSLALILGISLAFIIPLIVGKDIESAVHIGRLVFPVLALILVIFLVDAVSAPRKNILFILSIFLALLVFVAIVKNIHDRNIIHIPPIDVVQKEQRYAPILSQIQERGSAGVVWAPDELVPYIPAHTNAHVLFSPQGGLYVMSDEEQHTRYLVSRFPNTVTKESLIDDVGFYDLVAPKSYTEFSLRIHPCWLQKNCEQIATYTEFKGVSYFESLRQQYENQIVPHIKDYLDRYQVRLIVVPASSQLDSRISAKRVYTDEQYSLYERD